MKKEDFAKIRKKLKRTQKNMAALLAISHKTVESYEQGLRNIPVNMERILYYMLFKLNMDRLDVSSLCWNEKECPQGMRDNCVAWLANEGFFCWFMTGKTCPREKSLSANPPATCFDCSFFKRRLNRIFEA